jgi:hypothetical protein
MLRIIRCAGVACAIIGLAGSANASPVRFEFSSTCCGIGSTISGTSPGQAFELSIIADNGSSSVFNQTWSLSDYISASLNIGPYTATFDSSVGGSGFFSASTDATGNVTGISLLDNIGNFDSLGSADVVLIVNGNRNVVFTMSAYYADANDLTTPDQFSVTSAAPLPAALPLFGLGLGALGLLGWRRKRKVTALAGA